MQRSPQLAVLSREHHVALEIALRLQRATDDDHRSAITATLEFWEDEGCEHFAIEEQLLLPALAVHAGADDPDIQRILSEHADLRKRLNGLTRDTDRKTGELHELGEKLRDHVRYEERELFGRIEATLSVDELAALGKRLQSAGTTHHPPRA